MAKETVLDLRATRMTIKFDKGKTFDPVFYYYAPDYSVIDLTGWTARMQARLTLDAVTALPGFDLTTENGGLKIVIGTVSPEEDVFIDNAYGVEVNILPEVTAAFGWTSAVFDLELVSPGGKVRPFIKGTLLADDEATR